MTAHIDERVQVSDQAQTYEGYCVKCKAKRHCQGEIRTSASGRRMARGTCPTCSSTINCFLARA